eukprot:15888348-Heterocapsa_arctica.AAC.1
MCIRDSAIRSPQPFHEVQEHRRSASRTRPNSTLMSSKPWGFREFAPKLRLLVAHRQVQRRLVCTASA